MGTVYWLFICAIGKLSETSLYLYRLQFLFEPRSLSSPSLDKFPLFSYLTEHLFQVPCFSTTREEELQDCCFLHSCITKRTVPSCLPAEVQRHWQLCLELRGRRVSYVWQSAAKGMAEFKCLVVLMSREAIRWARYQLQDLDTGNWFKAVKPDKAEEKFTFWLCTAGT